MPQHLTPVQIVLLAVYALAMAGGQLLFKFAATRTPSTGTWGEWLAALLQNAAFDAAVLLYALLTFFWVWILTFTPLSRAYLFLTLAFAITPLASVLVFGEQISLRLVVGIALIAAGLLCVAG